MSSQQQKLVPGVGVSVMGLTLLLVGGMWIRKAAECFKQGLWSHTSRSVEESGAESSVNYGGLTQEDSGGKNIN